MFQQQDNRQKSPERRFLFVLGFVRIAFFFVLGLLIAFTNFFTFNIAREYKLLFGVILMLYAAGRTVVEIQSRKNRDR